MPVTGRYLALEGMDGCGKTTLSRWLVDWLSKRLPQPPLAVREPGGTPLGESIRSLLLANSSQGAAHPVHPATEALLFYAARTQLWLESIHPRLQQGQWVVSDRCELSSLVYQSYGRGIPLRSLQLLSENFLPGKSPDITFYLHLTPRQSRERCSGRSDSPDRIESYPLSFFERVYEGYAACQAWFPNVVEIDASANLALVQQQILKHILPWSVQASSE